jgi:HEAT repeat protein
MERYRDLACASAASLAFFLAVATGFSHQALGTDQAADSERLAKPVTRWSGELRHPDAQVRRRAALDLGKAGAVSVTAIPKLLRALKDPEPEVREAAASALGDIGPSAWDGVLPGLAYRVTDDRSANVRRVAALALGKLARQVITGDEEVADSVRGALERALKDAEAPVRQQAAWALGRLGPQKGRLALPTISQALKDTDPRVRRAAATALGEIGPAGGEAVPLLLSRFQEDPVPEVRKNALAALANVVGPGNRHLAKLVLPALGDKDPQVVQSAALALANMGGADAAPAVPVLCQALTSTETTNRRLAAAALAHLGSEATPAVDALGGALADSDLTVRRLAALALGRMGPKASAVVPALVKIVDADQPEELRVQAAEALANISPAIGPAVPTLQRVLKSDRSWRVRQRAVWALARLDRPDEAGLVAALTAILSETDRETRLVRYDSAIILGLYLGPKADSRTIDALQTLLEDKEVQVYSGSDAKVTRADQESGSEPTVTQNGSSDPRGLAARALARIGPKANRPEIIRRLKEAAEAPDPRVRQAANEALRQIQGS